MTVLRDAISDVLGGVSQLVGAPLAPPPPPPVPSKMELTPSQEAVLRYQGIDPDTATPVQIDRALGRTSGAPPPPPPVLPPPTLPAADPPPAPPPGMSGAAAEAAKRLDAAMAANHSALNDADEQLGGAVLQATSSSAAGKAKLASLQQEIIDQVTKMGDTLSTADGQRMYAEFLQGKVGEILDVVKSADLDSKSAAAILDGVAAQYQAAKDTAAAGGGKKADDPPAAKPAEDKPGDTTQPPAAATPTDPALTSDPLLSGGLPSDSLMSGLMPALGGLGGLGGMLPQALGGLGGMMPSFGGGGGGGLMPDLGGLIDPAVHNSHQQDGGGDIKPLKDPVTSDQKPPAPPSDPKQDTPQQPPGQNPAQPAAAAGGAQPPPPAAGPDQPPPATAGQSTQVTLPNNEVRAAPNAAVAQAARDVLGGQNVDDAYAKAGLQLPPPGAVVTAPVAPDKLQFGDVSQTADQGDRVMALGKDDVFAHGQVVPISQLQTGPGFLGWVRPTSAPASLPASAPPPTQ